MMEGQQFLRLDLSAQACRAAVEESLKDLQALPALSSACDPRLVPCA